MLKICRIMKRTAALALAAVVGMSFVPVDVYADTPVLVSAGESDQSFSAGDITADVGVGQDYEHQAVLNVFADNHNADVSVGNITNIAENGNGLMVVAQNSGFNSVFAGNVTGTGDDDNYNSYGLMAWATNKGTNLIETGDVTGGFNAVEIGSSLGGSNVVNVNGNAEGEFGAYLITQENGDNTLNVSGDVTGEVGLEAVAANSYGGSSGNAGRNDITVGGNIYGDDEGAGLYATNGGINSIYAGGDITSEEIGIEVVSSEGGVNKIFVEGSVSVDEGDSSVGIWSGVFEGGSNDIRIAGDVTSAGAGILFRKDKGGKSNIVVEGTIKADGTGLLNYNSPDGPGTISVWKIIPNDKGFVATKRIEDEEGGITAVEDVETEQEIQYIIKIDQPRFGARLSATAEDGSALATVEGVNDTYNVAHEGDTVLLKVDVAHGFIVTGAYSDEGQTVELVKDDCGNYYVEVPRGGGVVLSVTVSPAFKPTSIRIKDDSASDTVSSVPVVVTGCSVSSCASDSAALQAITAAGEGDNVCIDGSGTALSPCVVKALLARRDITVTVSIVVDGVTYKIVIPAGADLTTLTNECGGIDYYTLATAFGYCS